MERALVTEKRGDVGTRIELGNGGEQIIVEPHLDGPDRAGTRRGPPPELQPASHLAQPCPVQKKLGLPLKAQRAEVEVRLGGDEVEILKVAQRPLDAVERRLGRDRAV